MKKYVNYFYDIVTNIDNWDELDNTQKSSLLERFINKPKNTMFFVIYFDKLSSFYKKNTLNYFTKDIEELKI